MDTSAVATFRPTSSSFIQQFTYPIWIVVIVVTQILKPNDPSYWWIMIVAWLIFGWWQQRRLKQSCQLQISPQGIHFLPHAPKFSPYLKDVDAAQIKKIKIIENKTIWQVRNEPQIAIYVLFLPENMQGRPQVCLLNENDWRSDSGQFLVTSLQANFSGLIHVQIRKFTLQTIKIFDEIEDHPIALDLGLLAGISAWGSLASAIIGFLTTSLNPYESLTWGHYQTVVWYIAAIIGLITVLLFIFAKIKLLAKVINILIVVPLFSAAVTLLVHGFLMIGNDVFAPSTQTTFELVKQHDERDTWRSVQGWSMRCAHTQYHVGDQKTVMVKQGWFDLVRINPKRLCGAAK